MTENLNQKMIKESSSSLVSVFCDRKTKSAEFAFVFN